MIHSVIYPSIAFVQLISEPEIMAPAYMDGMRLRMAQSRIARSLCW